MKGRAVHFSLSPVFFLNFCSNILYAIDDMTQRNWARQVYGVLVGAHSGIATKRNGCSKLLSGWRLGRLHRCNRPNHNHSGALFKKCFSQAGPLDTAFVGKDFPSMEQAQWASLMDCCIQTTSTTPSLKISLYHTSGDILGPDIAFSKTTSQSTPLL